MWKKGRNFDCRKNPIEILRMTSPSENSKMQKRRVIQCYSLSLGWSSNFQHEFAASVWRAPALIEYMLCFIPFRCRSFLWIYFASGWQNRGEKIKQWWLRMFGVISVGCLSACAKCTETTFISVERVSWGHNRKNRNYSHWTQIYTGNTSSWCVHVDETKIHRQFTERRSRLRFVQMEKHIRKCSSFISMLLNTLLSSSQCNKKQTRKEVK